MPSPAELPPAPAELKTLYQAIGGLSVEFGLPHRSHSSEKYTVVPLSVLPASVIGRFPPDVEDLSANFLMRTEVTEVPFGRRKNPLLAGLELRRFTPPTDPHSRGFRHNEWTLLYNLAGDDLHNLSATIAFAGARKYSSPPVEPLKGNLRKLSKQDAELAWKADIGADGRTTNLRLPRGFVQPPLLAGEVNGLTRVVEGVHQFYREQDVQDYEAGVRVIAQQQLGSDG